jgi:hypothetical protein
LVDTKAAGFTQYYQVDPTAFLPFNDAPNYISGTIKADGSDRLIIKGSSLFHLQDWHSIGGRTELLEPHSFVITVSVLPVKSFGAYSFGITTDDRRPKINISHFLRSSVTLHDALFENNFYSGFGNDNDGIRTQTGVDAPWRATGRHHNYSIAYSHEEGMLSCLANGVEVHKIFGRLGKFRIELLAQAVGVEGDFEFRFENIYYFGESDVWRRNVEIIRGWDPRYPPVLVSYSHADKDIVTDMVNRLRHAGVRVLGDWDLGVGDSLIEKLAGLMKKAKFVIVALSPQSISSKWVNKELQIVLTEELDEESPTKVLPVLLQTCDIPKFLRNKLYLDWREAGEEALGQLLAKIRSLGIW